MSSPYAIARPYARAAFEAARDADQLSQWQESLQLAAEVARHPQMQALFANPLAARADCIELVLEAVASKSGVDLRPLLTVMAENRRLIALAELSKQFSLLKAEHEGTQPVVITSAVELSAGQKQALEQRLGERFGRRIDAVYSVDDSVIGGIRVRAGDTVYDASMHDQLRRLAEVINQA